MGRHHLVCLAVYVAALAPATAGARVLERTIVHQIEADGSVVETTRLRVQIDSDADLAAWSTYSLYLDDHRALERLEAASSSPGDKPVKLRRDAIDEVQLPGGSELHSSARYRVLRFPPLPLGSLLSIDHSVRARPYFPAGTIRLTGGEATGRLSVEVRGAAGLRYHLLGPASGLTLAPAADGVRVTAVDLPRAAALDYALATTSQGPTLLYSWGGAGDWTEVGRWFSKLTADLPRAEEAVRHEARNLIGGAASVPDRLAALTRFVQQKVRYVAVEVGVGGYRPYPPSEVLANRWGDCKGKSFLLIDLLREVGIVAYPALILAADDARVDPAFASSALFNHLIVAVPDRQLPPEALVGARAGGYLFVDPTLERGGIAWIHPSTQGQQALVVRDGGGELVETPTLAPLEASRLAVQLSVGPDGKAAGGAGLTLTGSTAAYLLDALATRSAAEVEALVRRLLALLLPAAEIGAINVEAASETADVPRLSVAGSLALPGFLPAGSDRFALRLPLGLSLPEPRLLSERSEPVVVRPQLVEVTIKVRLPTGWSLEGGQDQTVSNAVGTFSHSLSAPEPSTLLLERRLLVNRRWVEGGELAALKELSLAELRSSLRQVRLAAGSGAE